MHLVATTALTLYANLADGKIEHWYFGEPWLPTPVHWRGNSFLELRIAGTRFEIMQAVAICQPSTEGKLYRDLQEVLQEKCHRDQYSICDLLACFHPRVTWGMMESATVLFIRQLS